MYYILLYAYDVLTFPNPNFHRNQPTKNNIRNQFSQETEDGKTNGFFPEVFGICLEPSALSLSFFVDMAACFPF